MARRLKQNFNEVQAILDAVDHKVDKVEGKNLSTNDYTDEDRAKLSSVEEGAEPNVQGDWDQADTTSDDYIKNKPDLSVKADLPLEDVDIPGLTVRNGYITSSGVWNSGSVYCHTLLPVSAGKAVRVTAAESNLFRYAWLTSGQAPRGGIAADLVPGTERTDVAAGTSVTLAVPEGAKYLYIYLGTPADKAKTPESLAVSDTITSLRISAGELEEEIAKVEDDMSCAGTYGSFDGAGSTLVSDRKIKVVGGRSYRVNILTPDVTVTSPTGNAWRLTVDAYAGSTRTERLVQVSDVSALKDYYDITIPEGSEALLVSGRCAVGETFGYSVTELATVTYNDGDILTLNPDSEFQPKFQSAAKPYWTSSQTSNPNCVRFLHLSDIHANWANVKRFLRFYNHWVDKGYDITAINTGDIVSDKLSDGYSGYTSIDGVGAILNVIGNHDTRGTDGWQDNVGLPVYNAFIAPFVSGWGVTQPAGAAENGYCYYYRDYSTNKLRLVITDVMGYDETQDAWLASVLSDAKTLGYHVLIATHFAAGRAPAEADKPSYEKIDCLWSSLSGLSSDSIQYNGYNYQAYKMADTVHSYMENGGIFCGYMCGHVHREYVARLAKYPDQMVYMVGSSKSGKVTDYTHTTGTRMQDEFQLVAVDTVSKLVKLYKVGANYDRRGRLKDSVCVSYDSHEVVGFPVTGEALAKEMDGKQDTISDLSEIREGAAAGATALQQADLNGYAKEGYVDEEVSAKQDTLVSGTNIKTINGESILGEGNIQIEGSQSVQSDWNEDDSTDPAYIKNKPTIPTVPTDIVKYTEQELTEAQQEQARDNIAAASESEVSQLRSEVYKDLPFTKDKYYVNLSSATVGSTYQFAELSFSPFAYWVIPCKEGDQFKLTTSSNTATAKAYAILDKNNVVLAVQQTKVTDFNLVIPTGGATLIVNTATANPYMVRTQRYATKEELAETDERLSDEIANIAYTADPILENPLRGVDFGTTAEAVKNAITKIWLQSLNPANVPKVIANAPKLYIRYISNATGANRPAVLINDTLEGADTDAVISYALSSQSEPRAVKEIIRAKTLGGTNTAWGLGTDGANIYIEIDWSKISGTIRNLEIELNTANLQKMEVDRVALSDVSGPIIQGSLSGKNIVCFGDSLTELADLNSFRYSDYLAAFSGANIVNVGIGGAQLRQRLEPVTTPTSNAEAYAALDVVNMIQASIDQDFTKQVAAAEYLRDHASDDNTEVVTRLQGINWAKVDAVTIFAGTNDWYSGSNIGTTGTVGKSTTIGAINYIIQNLLGTYPHVKIFWFTPVVRWESYTGGSGTAENFGDTYTAGRYTLKAFAALVKDEVSLSHIPVCDLYNTLGWNMWNFSNYFPDNDGTHPRKPAGMRGIAARMFGFLTSHKNY